MASLTGEGYPDTENDIICGTVCSLSLLAIFEENIATVVDEITAPIDPISVGTPITVSADFIDPNVSNTHTAVWDLGDGTTSDGTVNESEGSVEGPTIIGGRSIVIHKE